MNYLVVQNSTLLAAGDGILKTRAIHKFFKKDILPASKISKAGILFDKTSLQQNH